ncbi:hypothetical protein TBLA_0E03340 [Henningerozyma blattae CBS 6284]|uniref:Uncharacterized protein n=1 Tax=Henningerozyma blattae (strain ATCC 34711 / CBS 6284 / DSM 70876 / NBRC 10599 / NRRL Y-10934 / UCD 77-7) TaxID=1071380 RepID=I2H4T6_HENB6|nr:hypothetical protein TBLA_0E03340 [Tetrapisispora blattae CBS 6284]CCH61388.1 hypothetical protein TBLA_0E03340 [Tetrapisispora blattae CBS 6284]
MNRGEQEFRDRHLNQKYDLIHFLPSLGIPQLSGFYFKNFLNASKRYHLQLSEIITTKDSKFCGSCGCVRIPNVNFDMLVENIEGDNGQQRILKYTCRNCKHCSKFELETPNIGKKREDNKKEEDFIATWPSKKSANKVEKKTTSARDRSKKRKMNSLLNRLKEKNDQKLKSSSSVLSLESFMKN